MNTSKNNPENPLIQVQSTDWNATRLETLKQLFPDLFTNEGKLNLHELKKVVDPESVSETERYEFRWFGKSAAKRNAFSPSNATLVLDKHRSVNPTETENLIIEGENLEVLKLLSTAYREKVKCIYIDPPYNTGKDFVYSDNYTQDKKAYWEDAGVIEEGLKIDTNTETDGRYHSNWLNMMYSRLLIARQLLREDGVIFISIDDNEVHHLRKLCDEVFGEENFMANIVWQKKYAATNDAKGFSPMHDHIIVYSKSELFERNLLPRTEEQDKPYVNDDGDGKGLWRSDNLLVKSFSESGVFPIINPNNGKEYLPPQGSCWRASKTTIEEWLKEGRIFFGKDGNGAPQLKRYLNEVQKGRVPTTWWTFQEVGHNDAANKEMQSLFDSKSPFDTPKPSKLIRQIIKIATDKNDIILDFFAGSGTTGQAVLEQNVEELYDRKFILVQIPEVTDDKSEAFKAGYKKISDITIERNKRVVERIIKEKKKEQPDLFTNGNSVNSNLGFKVFKLVKSNFPRVEFAPDPEKTTEENIELLKKYIRDKEAQLVNAFNKEELITEILIKNGFMLNYTLEKQPEFTKNEVLLAKEKSYSPLNSTHSVNSDNPINSANSVNSDPDNGKETLLCLDNEIDMETVEHFKQINSGKSINSKNSGKKFICLERALDTTKKWNLKHYLGDKFKAF